MSNVLFLPLGHPVADAGLVEDVGGAVGVVAQLAAELLGGGAHPPLVGRPPQAPYPSQQPVVGHHATGVDR